MKVHVVVGVRENGEGYGQPLMAFEDAEDALEFSIVRSALCNVAVFEMDTQPSSPEMRARLRRARLRLAS